MGGSVLMDFGGTESCQGLLSRLYNHDHLSFFFQSICIIFVLAHLDANEQTVITIALVTMHTTYSHWCD